METAQLTTVRAQAESLLRQSNWVLTKEEWQAFSVNDFGLGDVFSEGFAFVDLLRSPRLRITLWVLLPHQSLPEHMHPSYENETGKEETVRVLCGQTKVYVPGPDNNPNILIPRGKTSYYTARHEVLLNAGEQYTVRPTLEHWFQGGSEGSVNLGFQNRVDETQNVFTDPQSLGCPIKLSD